MNAAAPTSTPHGESSARLHALAARLDCFTEAEVCELCNITALTLEAWRKRRRGPAFTRAGNRVLYPRTAVLEFLHSHVRQPASGDGGGNLL